MSIITFRDCANEEFLLANYENLYFKVVNKLQNKNEYKTLDTQINTFSRTINGVYDVPIKLIDNFITAVSEKIALEYEKANEFAFFSGKNITKDYGTTYNRAVKSLQKNYEYNLYKSEIDSILNVLNNHTDTNEIILNWLYLAVSRKVSMEYESTNKIVFYYLRKLA